MLHPHQPEVYILPGWEEKEISFLPTVPGIRIECHWTDMCHVIIPDPIIWAGRQGWNQLIGQARALGAGGGVKPHQKPCGLRMGEGVPQSTLGFVIRRTVAPIFTTMADSWRQTVRETGKNEKGRGSQSTAGFRQSLDWLLGRA